MTNDSLQIAVVDVGSLTNLGWAVEGASFSEEGRDIDECIEVLAAASKSGPLALGFECPTFVPYGRQRSDLDKCREGEGDRAFGASAGATVLAKGLVVVPYILEGLRSRIKDVRPTFDWRGQLFKEDLLLFEAFVTNMGKLASHIECARVAINRFREGSKDRASLESAVKEKCTMNLLSAMLLRMGWTKDLAMLSEPCLVVRHRGNAK